MDLNFIFLLWAAKIKRSSKYVSDIAPIAHNFWIGNSVLWKYKRCLIQAGRCIRSFTLNMKWKIFSKTSRITSIMCISECYARLLSLQCYNPSFWKAYLCVSPDFGTKKSSYKNIRKIQGFIKQSFLFRVCI